MAGALRLDGFTDRGMGFGWGDQHLSLGAAKVMLSAVSGRLSPDPDTLRNIVAGAREYGFQTAIHAVEAKAVSAAIDALAGPAGHTSRRDRIEHCSECPPEHLRQAGRIRAGRGPTAGLHLRERAAIPVERTGGHTPLALSDGLSRSAPGPGGVRLGRPRRGTGPVRRDVRGCGSTGPHRRGGGSGRRGLTPRPR